MPLGGGGDECLESERPLLRTVPVAREGNAELSPARPLSPWMPSRGIAGVRKVKMLWVLLLVNTGSGGVGSGTVLNL